MYFPYFRGKQFELLAVRENAELIAKFRFVPIIEPVKESLTGLKRALDTLQGTGASAVLILNPHHGHHSADSKAIHALFREQLEGNDSVSVGIALTENGTLQATEALLQEYEDREVTLVHAGFSQGRQLAQRLTDFQNVARHVFVGKYCGKLYQRHFRRQQRVLLKDGFVRRRNRDYPTEEFFSDLHAVYEEEGMNGFGDFLIVGDDYSEEGGPAYAVAIHLTFIDPERDGEMRVFHFLSERQDTPTDPAGKFAESLLKLVYEIEKPGTHLLRTSAVEKFLDLHQRGHYPGLGFVKKLSMQHHLETIAKSLGTS